MRKQAVITIRERYGGGPVSWADAACAMRIRRQPASLTIEGRSRTGIDRESLIDFSQIGQQSIAFIRQVAHAQ